MTERTRWTTDFRWLWTAMGTSALGSQISELAIPLLAVVTLDAGAAELGLVGAARWLPFLLLALPLGVLVDRQRRKNLMVTADVARAVLSVILVALAVCGLLGLPGLIVLVLVMGAFTVLFEVSYQSLIPTVVSRDSLDRANGRLYATESVAAVGGPGLGGILVQLITAPGALLVHGGIYATSAFALSRIRSVEERPAQSETPGFRAQLRQGMSFVARDKVLVSIVGFSGIYNFSEQWIMTLFLVYAVNTAGFSAAGLGIVLSLGAIGAVVGAALAPATLRRFGAGRTSLCCAAIECTVLLGIPLAAWLELDQLALAAVFASVFAVNGAATALSGVVVVTLRQRRTPNELLGRVNASMRWITFGTVSLGALVGGLIGSTVGLVPGIAIGCAFSLLTIVWVASTALARSDDGKHGAEDDPAAVEGQIEALESRTD